MSKNALIGSLLLLLLPALALLDICCGSVFIPLWDLIGRTAADWEDPVSVVSAQIMWQLRLPKMLTAILAGVGLSVSGALMQTLFRNPLAGPYILGVSSGASLGVAVITLLGAQCTMHNAQCVVGNTQLGIAGAAIIGSLIVLLLMLGVARKVRDNVSLLIVGMMFGAIAGALVSVLQNISNPDALKLFIVWTLGSLGNVGWSRLAVLAVVVCVGILIAVGLLKPLNGLLLGENYARGLGVKIERVRLWIIIATGLLAGGITAFCGPIAFVGVAVPHIARGLFRTSDHRVILPAAAVIGADLVLLCDLLCSISTYPLPISTVSALFGAPVIIWIIIKNKI